MAEPRICSVDGCSKRVIARNFCKSHYNRFMDHGDPLAGQAPRGLPRKWLDDHVEHSGDDCLIWPFGGYCGGYGAIKRNGRTEYAHRMMCELAHGPAPSPEHEAAHSCGHGNEGCVNPRHLRWATRSENCNDRTLHGTQNRGERCGNAKLTDDDVRIIRGLRGIKSQKSLADEYGVTKTTIYAIQKRKLWGWLT